MEFSEEFMRDYLLGKANASNAQQFEEALVDNKALRTSLDEMRDLIIGARLAEEHGLREKLKAIDKAQKTDKNIVALPANIRWWWTSAAAILIAVASIFLYLYNQPSNTELYQAYFSGYPNIISPGQRDENNQSSAFIAYQNGNWSEAIEAFQKIPTEAGEVYPDFYAALSFMQLGSFNEAIPMLEKVIEDNDIRFTDAARWYLALTYVATKNDRTAVDLLQVLTETESNFKKDAQNLLKELE